VPASSAKLTLLEAASYINIQELLASPVDVISTIIPNKFLYPLLSPTVNVNTWEEPAPELGETANVATVGSPID
jgi:hypothetical protein